MEVNSIFEEYGLVEAEIAALEAKKKQLRPFILKSLLDQGLEKVDTSVGKFSIQRLKKWTFPDYIVEQEEDLKAAKEKAKSTNEATYEEEEGFRFTKATL